MRARLEHALENASGAMPPILPPSKTPTTASRKPSVERPISTIAMFRIVFPLIRTTRNLNFHPAGRAAKFGRRLDSTMAENRNHPLRRHEFADSARMYCPWTKARYRMLRDRGMKHHAAIRKLARSWIRILFRVWQTGTPFDYDRYIAQLKQRCPEITRYLPQQN